MSVFPSHNIMHTKTVDSGVDGMYIEFGREGFCGIANKIAFI